MSRRKPELPELPSAAYSHNQSVRIICTDRQQHAPVLLCHMTDTRHVRTKRDVMWRRETPEGAPLRSGSPLASWTRTDGMPTYRFRCPGCPQDVRLREDKLFLVLGVLNGQRSGNDDTRHPVLDVSLLS